MTGDGDSGKTHVQTVDFVDAGHPALMRMWAKRQVGYRAMGYRVAAAVARRTSARAAAVTSARQQC